MFNQAFAIWPLHAFVNHDHASDVYIHTYMYIHHLSPVHVSSLPVPTHVDDHEDDGQLHSGHRPGQGDPGRSELLCGEQSGGRLLRERAHVRRPGSGGSAEHGLPHNE